MGYAKNKMMAWEQVLVHPFEGDKNVCAEHFSDPYLQDYIRENGHYGICSYCKKQHSKVLKMSAFLQYVGEKLSQRFCTVDQADLSLADIYYDDEEEEIPGLSRVGSFVIPDDVECYETAQEMIENYGLYTENENLDNDIKSCFNEDNIWIQNEAFDLELDEELLYGWDYFSKMVKSKRRYTFFSDPYFVGKEEWKDDVLTEINQLFGNILISKLPVGTTIFRGRTNDTDKPYTLFKDLTSPPANYAKANRMSAMGISMFYGALDKETPIKEIQNYAPDAMVDLGMFKLTKELKVVDLFKIPEQLSFWMPKNFREYEFLKKFHSEITKPIEKNAGIEYVPTQIFTEYIRFMNNYHIDGIVYRSSLTGKKNLALFYDDKTSERVLQLISSSRYQGK